MTTRTRRRAEVARVAKEPTQCEKCGVEYIGRHTDSECMDRVIGDLCLRMIRVEGVLAAILEQVNQSLARMEARKEETPGLYVPPGSGTFIHTK